MAYDFQRNIQYSTENPHQSIDHLLLWNQVLLALQVILHNQSSSLEHYNLPIPTCQNSADQTHDLIAQQLDYNTIEEDAAYKSLHSMLNQAQKNAYDTVIASVKDNSGKLYFLYGHGGTGKTYLYNCIISKLRSEGKIVLVVASSGIAATLLPGGVTAHSRFKIPVEVDQNSTCAIKKGTNLARLIEQTSLIIWDEAPMVHKHSFEALDRSLCDIMNTPQHGVDYKPFGGKTVLLGGDFRQTLPIVTNGGREDNLVASLTRSYLWHYCILQRLDTNMRILESTANSTPTFGGKTFSEWVLSIGNGTVPKSILNSKGDKDLINVPQRFIIPSTTTTVATLVGKVYPDLANSYASIQYIKERAIVTPTNKIVMVINDYILSLLPGEEKSYPSLDSLTTFNSRQDQMELEYPTEFLNTISLNGLPEHELRFNPFTVVMLLRNINPSTGLCNGSRILLTHLGTNVLRDLIIGRTFADTIAIIPRIILEKAHPNWPFTLKRRQFLVRLCYAMTINKSQGQTLNMVGLYLPSPVFSHGQLYVAVSRVRSAHGLHVVIENEHSMPEDTTSNIMYNEIFEDLEPDHNHVI